METDVLLTAAQVAEQLKISRYQVYRRILRGDLPARSAQRGNTHYLIRQSDVDAYIAAGGTDYVTPPRADVVEMMTVPQVALATGFSPERVRRMCRSGQLPHVKGVGDRGQYRIPRQCVDALRR